MSDTALTSTGLDPRVALATGMHAQPGVYALLLGSGVSTGAGIPTGWGVVAELTRRVAAASGEAPDGDDFDVEKWWGQRFDRPLGYSSLLEELAATPGARRALLASFFEPSDEDRQEGRRVPGPAHKAVASLVARGSVRVILTTNFDRLTEQALEADGILPQVIASPAAVAGMEPLPHARCTVVKLHGDYATLDQLNTADELSEYATATNELLTRVLDEYGLIVCGWSGEWDHALVAALESTRVRRYPLYWSSYGPLSDAAKRLVGHHRAQVIHGMSADRFFPDLVGRIEAIDTLAAPPLSRLMAVAQLKRYVPSASKHILLRDLLAAHVERVREHVQAHPQQAPSNEPAALEELHTGLREGVDTLLHLVAQGVYFDRDRGHTDLWVWVIEQLMRARTSPDGTFHPWCDALQHYPALLALRTGVLAALAAGREDVLIELLRRPTWSDRLGGGRDVPAFAALHDYRVLDHEVVLSFPSWNGQRWLYPRSRLLRETLQPVLEPLVGERDSYVQLCNRGEYRIALAQTLFDEEGSYYGASPGEFIGERQWSAGGLAWETDFRERADHFAWGWDRDPGAETDPFGDQLDQLSEELKKSRRWG